MVVYPICFCWTDFDIHRLCRSHTFEFGRSFKGQSYLVAVGFAFDGLFFDGLDMDWNLLAVLLFDGCCCTTAEMAFCTAVAHS
ncbi:hypothetical protein CGZ65_05560 [Neisseria weixii]|nr:hypothetical protein CGZ65_05560 [Neisseria weixii]